MLSRHRIITSIVPDAIGARRHPETYSCSGSTTTKS